MSLATNILLKVGALLEGSNDLGSPVFPLNYNPNFNLATGTGASQADLLFSDTRTLGASATEDLDLAGSLVDPLGATLTFVTIKGIIIKAASANTNDVEVKPAAANGFIGPFNAAADTLIIPPGGMIVLMAPVSGWAVTAGTGDLLTITNGAAGTGVDYDIILIGASA
jgi:hypothetical protein